MDAEFADRGVDRRHFGGEIGGNLHFLARGEDIELAGIEDDFAATAIPARDADRFPEIGEIARRGAIDVDQAGMALGAIANEPIGVGAVEIDRNGDTALKHRVARGYKPFARMQGAVLLVVQHARGVAKARLRQARTRARENGEGLGRYLGEERPLIRGGDGVEGARAIGDDPREHVNAPRRTLGVRGGGDPGRQGKPLQQFGHVNAAGFEHSPIRKVDLMQAQLPDAILDFHAKAGQKTRAHAPGAAAQSQIKAGRLHLPRREWRRDDMSSRRERLDLPCGEDAAALQPGRF